MEVVCCVYNYENKEVTYKRLLGKGRLGVNFVFPFNGVQKSMS